MRYVIQEGEFIPQQPRRTKEWRNTPLSNLYSEIHDEQRKMNAKIIMLIDKMAKKNLISPVASSKDDDEIN